MGALKPHLVLIGGYWFCKDFKESPVGSIGETPEEAFMYWASANRKGMQ